MGSGEIRLYCKKATESVYVKRLEWIGPTLAMEKDGYLKWGMYKADWINPTGGTKRVIYHDNIKVGTTFAEADPSIMLPAGWSTQNVGSVGAPGYATATGGVFTLRGSGLGGDSTSDGFRYASQTLSGEGELTARLVSMSNHGNPLAGIMARETTAAGSKYYFFGRNIGGTMNTKHRTSTGGSVYTTILGTATVPMWVRMTRVGDVLTAYKSTDGTVWTAVSSQTLSMASEIRVGLMTTSRHATATTTATFDNHTDHPGLQMSVVPAMLQRWAQQDPTSAAAWAESIPNATLRMQGLDAMLRVWVHENPGSLQSWWRKVPAGGFRDEAAAAMVGILVDTDRSAALLYAEGITDGDLRASALERFSTQ
jgi:hypothetical protein